MTPEPESVTSVDRQLARSVRGLHRLPWAMVTTLGVFVAAALAVFGWMVVVQQDRLEASCNFYRLIATLPVASHPPPGRPLILFILDSRDAYAGQGCGSLPAAGAGLVRWSAHYHLKVKT